MNVEETTRVHRRARRFGSVLVELRNAQGLSRGQLAEAATIDRSVLSRIERGAYPHQITASLVGKLTAVVGGGMALYRAAGIAPPEAAELVAAPDVSEAFHDLHSVRRALRQVHLENLALPVAERSRTRTGLQIDAGRLWNAAGGQGRAPTNSGPGQPIDPTQRRFQAAHATAHLILDCECAWPRVSPPELDANDLACALLVPRPLIAHALKAAFADTLEPWSTDAGGLVAFVAEYFLVPGWVALRRIGIADELNYYLEPDEESG
jgi:transcriptional regulator with XRE-family HTH domain